MGILSHTEGKYMKFNLNSMYEVAAKSPLGTRFMDSNKVEWVKTEFGLRKALIYNEISRGKPPECCTARFFSRRSGATEIQIPVESPSLQKGGQEERNVVLDYWVTNSMGRANPVPK